MQKVGRKATLTVEQALSLEADYREFLRAQAIARRLAPHALARKYHISASTVIDYGLGRHKGHANHGLSRGEIREALSQETLTRIGVTGDLFGSEVQELSLSAPKRIVRKERAGAPSAAAAPASALA